MLPSHRLISDIDHLLEQKKRIVVAIDGMSGAGKSSYAKMLAYSYKCDLIHMDHFFLQPLQRTPERLMMPGGNVDIERFLTEAALPLTLGSSFSYKPYDCKTQGFLEPVVISPGPLTIVEGVYSTSPEIIKMNIYDITVFMRLDENEQHKRLKKRNPELYKRFVDEWIPMEHKYFEAFDIPEKCDYLIENWSEK